MSEIVFLILTVSQSSREFIKSTIQIISVINMYEVLQIEDLYIRF